MQHSHHFIFVLLSVFVAVLGSWTALDLFRRVRANAGRTKFAWLWAAAVAMGLSIWSMHFIAMLGFDPGSPVRYDPLLTALSLAIAVGATAAAFFAAEHGAGRLRLALSGLLMGSGICAMHYVGMAALKSAVSLGYDPGLVVLSFVVAVIAAIGALAAARRDGSYQWRAIAAVTLGFAVAGMHYTAMAAVRLTPSGAALSVPAGLGPVAVAFGVAAATLFLLLLALLAALFDRRFEAQAARDALGAQRQLQAVLEHLPVGVFVVDAGTGRVRLANSEAERLFRHPVGESAIWDTPGDYGAVDAQGRRIHPHGYALHEALAEGRRVGPRLQPYRRGDGEVVTFEVSAAPVFGEGNRLVSGIVAFQDVTAKLAGEDAARKASALEESEERFRLMAEMAPVMLWMTDADGHCVFLNRSLRDFWGAAEDLSQFDWFSTVHPDDRDAVMASFEHSLREARPINVEARYRRGDGAIRILQTVAQPRLSGDGTFLGRIGVNVDVTDTRAAEAAQQRITELLEERVAAALKEKDEAESRLVHAQRLEAIGRLTGGVAHDFNNLLTVVIGGLDMLTRTDDPGRRTRWVDAALAAARRGERLTQQLLAFSRRQTLRPQLVDLNSLLGVGEPLLRKAGGEATFALRLSGEPAVVDLDPAQLEAAVLNLVVNAADATAADGRIEVEVTRRMLRAGEVSELEPGPYVCVAVTDTGTGMPPDVAAKAFEPFFTTKPPGKGTGLGLSQVYGFIRQTGGGVQIDTAVGRGTTVRLYLPAATGDGRRAAADAAPGAGAKLAKALRVLVVEDDQAVMDVIDGMLRELGYDVRTAANADAALAILSGPEPVDMLLSDIQIPGGLNGIDLARQAVLRQPRLHVILSSGYAGETIDAALAQVPWPLLRKPYTQAELAGCLDTLLNPAEGKRTPAELV